MEHDNNKLLDRKYNNIYFHIIYDNIFVCTIMLIDLLLLELYYYCCFYFAGLSEIEKNVLNGNICFKVLFFVFPICFCFPYAINH